LEEFAQPSIRRHWNGQENQETEIHGYEEAICWQAPARFDTRIVHPFASNHCRQPLHPDLKTDDHDLEAIFHAAGQGYGLATFPVGEG
jgi:hypothetical protein